MLWLLACASPEWTAPDVLRGSLAALDTDHDGTLTHAECVPKRMTEADFTKIDTDQDGVVSAAELEAQLRGTDPLEWRTRTDPEHPVKGKNDNGRARGLPRDGIAPRWLLEELREEVLARDPNATVPTRQTLDEAAVGGEGTPAWVDAMRQLDAAWTAVGLTLPPSVSKLPAAPPAATPAGG
jgi:hypothetical protein